MGVVTESALQNDGKNNAVMLVRQLRDGAYRGIFAGLVVWDKAPRRKGTFNGLKLELNIFYGLWKHLCEGATIRGRKALRQEICRPESRPVLMCAVENVL